MKIWFYSSNMPIPQVNFNPRPGRLRILAQGLADLGHEVSFLTSSFDHANRTHQKAMSGKQFGVEYKAVKSIGYTRNVSIRRKLDYEYSAYLLYKESAKIIKNNPEKKPDVIFVNWPSIEITSVAIQLGKRFEVPVIVGVSDLWPDNWISSVSSKILKTFFGIYIKLVRKKASKILSQADSITGLTEEYVDWAKELAAEFKGGSFVLPMTYIDPKNTNFNDKPDTFTIAFAGTFNHQFDFDWLYNLAEYLAKEDSEIEFLLAGDGDSRLGIERKFKHLRNVKFLGFLQDAELKQLLKDASFGVAHYKNTDHLVKNLPNKPVEYLANCLPIICPIEGCIMELIQKNKVGIAAFDMSIQQVGDKIIDLKRNPEELEKMSRASRSTYENSFKPETIIKLLDEKMKSLILEYGEKGNERRH